MNRIIYTSVFSTFFILSNCYADTINESASDNIKPSNFVNVANVIPEAQFDMRYYGLHNFVGTKIDGYEKPICLLTKDAASSLRQVEDKLLPMGLTLKLYDCYRPQRAVNHFARWATDINDNKMKTEFYPTVDKRNLFKEDYIAYKSGHSRGSTMDLTIVPLNSKIPVINASKKYAACTSSIEKRSPDNSLDFGTGFDCFSPIAHPSYQNLSPQMKANRLLLNTLMQDAGFKAIDSEWWHFTLKNEPYPDTYFDFLVND
ncbi:MAG: M15 family metallopeptidase [Burkholderiales bacterium]|nr:M15 family metallopeptidase [Burkholderiales bacterium]